MGYAKVVLTELSHQEEEEALKFIESCYININNGEEGGIPSYLIIALQENMFSEELQYLGNFLSINIESFLTYNGTSKILLLYKATSEYNFYRVALNRLTTINGVQGSVNINSDEFKDIHKSTRETLYQIFTAPNGVKLYIETHSKEDLEIKHNKESILLLNS